MDLSYDDLIAGAVAHDVSINADVYLDVRARKVCAAGMAGLILLGWNRMAEMCENELVYPEKIASEAGFDPRKLEALEEGYEQWNDEDEDYIRPEGIYRKYYNIGLRLREEGGL
jgi:hypothetical protein